MTPLPLLHQRRDGKQLPRQVPISEWSTLDPKIRDTIPEWLKQLLSMFSLVDGVLEYRDRREPFSRLFSFFDPSHFAVALAKDSLTSRLLDFGFLPFAHESDGSVWVLSDFGRTTGPVFLLVLPEWNGECPSESNGLVFAAARLEFALASMAVSEASFSKHPGLPKRVFWYSER